MLRRARTAGLLPIVALLVGAPTSACTGGDEGPGGTGGSGAGGGTTTSTSSTGGAGGATSCEDFGHFGPPGETFALPAGGDAIYYPDLQASFPEVDWSTLDRLYVPAGSYRHVSLGNLPVREASRPLVITNQGGQVRVGPDLGGNYIWSISGGANWILTGRYDPDSGTGDEGFQGHRCGAYATSRGHYGFHSDDAFDLSAPYLHMGLAVGDASDFEIEYVEVERSGFAGFRFLNQATSQDDHPMSHVKLHDTYVHDVAGEGIYLGWTGGAPSNLMRGLEVYNNRFVRTGNEALQVQQLGEGSHVHHNVMLHAALHYRDNPLGPWQDNDSQVLMREGGVLIEKNVFLGSANLLLNLFGSPEPGDADIHLTFVDNYLSDDRVGQAMYFNGAVTPTSTYDFERNVFRGLAFGYDVIDPNATDPKIVFSANASMQAQITFSNNTWEGDEGVTWGLAGPDGATANVTAVGNTVGPVAPFAFRDALDVPGTALEFWTAATTRAPGSPPRTYEPGEVVLHVDGMLYRATATNTDAPPSEHPEAWEPLPAPVDDLRAVEGSVYEGLGVY